MICGVALTSNFRLEKYGAGQPLLLAQGDCAALFVRVQVGSTGRLNGVEGLVEWLGQACKFACTLERPRFTTSFKTSENKSSRKAAGFF